MKRAGGGVDFISSLPDEILHHILANTPTKLAIRTSVLSKRWKHVWYETPSISIVCNRVDPDSLNKTLSSYSTPKIKSFDVTISRDVTVPEIDTWINLALSRKAENVSLRFTSHYRFRDTFFINSSLKQLSLTLVYCILNPKCVVSWSSLRNLSLNRCKVSDDSIAKILSGCSLLESLTLNLCDRLNDLDLSKSLSLRRLEILGDRWTPERIVAPHIRYLRLENYQRPSTLVDVSSLTEANLGLSKHVLDYFTCEMETESFQYMVRQTVVKLQNIKKLTIGGIFLQEHMKSLCGIWKLEVVRLPEFNIEALTVETRIDQSVIPGLARLLQNSPGLKRITVNITKCNTTPDKHLDRHLKLRGLNPDQSWISKYGVFPTVEQTSAKMKHVDSFIKLVMGNTKTLEKLVLQFGDYLDAACQMVPTLSYDDIQIVIKKRRS
ncbi:F-box domain [Arabidopsis thaliana x Arabidopsis arenosa]|uniref:F-box domain n=1 Tax=Arabidopsis thaliana x Arabidopsis arenosa TaxID=1240361 RepID=A0A8T2CNB6_9BRAS|nr:F-box domain [Arabidopsis thaliana x Arabidopsis arenosa]